MHEKAAPDGATNTAERLTSHLNEEDDMATNDNTSNPRRIRRKHPQVPAEVPNAAPLAAADAPTPAAAPPPAPPRTLEQAIEDVRTLLFQVRGVLHCLAEVLLHSDDDDGVMHADVAQAAERWIDEATRALDIMRLQPLIDAIRERDGGTGSEGESDLCRRELFQVKEPTPVAEIVREARDLRRAHHVRSRSSPVQPARQ
jgi:hypothetical protein